MQQDEFDKYFDVDERREEARLNLGADIFVVTQTQEPGEHQPPKIHSCDAVDMSANGLQVLLDTELKSGAIHTLLVTLDAPKKEFRLTAEVKWVRPHESGYLAGLMLYESDGTEIINWKLMMARHLN